jgi:hypothetical protein
MFFDDENESTGYTHAISDVLFAVIAVAIATAGAMLVWIVRGWF